RDHLTEAEKQAHLNHQHDREHDADQGCDETQPVVEKIARGKRHDQRHLADLIPHHVRSATAPSCEIAEGRRDGVLRDGVLATVLTIAPAAVLVSQLSTSATEKTMSIFAGACSVLPTSAYPSQSTKT